MTSLSATIFGIDLVLTDELNDIYGAKIDGYDTDANLQLLTVLTILGLMAGSLSSGFFVAKGRRITLIIGSIIGLVGAGLQLILNF